MFGASLVILGAQPSFGMSGEAYRDEIQQAIATTRMQMQAPHEQEKVSDHQKGQPSRKSEDLPAVENQGPAVFAAQRVVQCIGAACANHGVDKVLSDVADTIDLAIGASKSFDKSVKESTKSMQDMQYRQDIKRSNDHVNIKYQRPFAPVGFQGAHQIRLG